MSNNNDTRRSVLMVVGVVFALGLAWAMVARVAWEDYYITYRASKNLAEGNGLVFTPGERVHSFTSPLGVLLPALSYLLTGRTSDDAALWIFRVMSFAALAGAAGFMWSALRRLRPDQPWVAILAVAWLATDSKTLVFTTGGMETGVLLLFLSWMLWACVTAPARFAWHLGVTWAGLMWSRPDSCVYIAAVGIGLLVFSRREGGAVVPRARMLRELLVAGAICAVLYGPWFAWAWSYYGSPVPHTIVAKGLFQETGLGLIAREVASFPRTWWHGDSSLIYTFLPYYGGLPTALEFMRPGFFWLASVMIALLGAPGVSREVRLAAWVFLVGHLYLTIMTKFPAPWYVPQVAWLGVFALLLALGQWSAGERAARWRRGAAWVVAGALVAGSALWAGIMAWQGRLESLVIEQGVRRPIGEWLRREAASPRDTVFLEPLGYIGFYSGLKMLDYPGLSSPEVVAARKLAPNRSYPYGWGHLIPILRPDWVVIRPFERDEVNKNDPLVLAGSYDRVHVFDVTARIAALPAVPLRGYLNYNGVFEVYRRKATAPRARAAGVVAAPVGLKDFTSAQALVPANDSANGISAHAPSRLVLPLREGATHLSGGFGIFEGAYTGAPDKATDGAEFVISAVWPDGQKRELLRRSLRPGTESGDRGAQSFELALAGLPAGVVLELVTEPGPSGSAAFDWTYWRELNFESRVGTSAEGRGR
jgi:hypothetical protein